MTDKLIRDGKVAVIYSPGSGEGWSSWVEDAYAEFFMFDRQLAEMVLSGDLSGVADYIEAHCPKSYCSASSIATLQVGWVPQGSPFYIHEYDGDEHLVLDFRTA